ncbi:MAG: hypothetical protein ACK5U7_01895 [Bacteroidota bacterium]|jgi:hypothetical protein
MAKSRRIVSVFVLLLTMAAPLTMRLWVTVDFWMNREAYSAYFCQNKEVKELDCKGRCHLARSLDAGQSEPALPQLPAETFLSEAMPAGHCEIPGPADPLRQAFLPYVTALHANPPTAGIDHPPRKA